MKNLKEKRERVATLIAENDLIANAVEAGNVTEEQRTAFDSNISEMETLKKDIVILEQRAAVPVTLAVPNKEAEEIRKNVCLSDFVKAASEHRSDGFVAEMAQEGEREMRAFGHEPKGIAIPQKALDAIVQKRSMVVGTSSSGGYAVPTQVMTFIEALWARSVFAPLGVVPMTGLYGNINFPTTAAFTSTFQTEVASVSNNQPTIGTVAMSAKRLPALIEASKNLLMNSQVSDQFLLNQIIKSIYTALENAAIQGSGSGAVPTGILNTSGIGSVAIGTNGGAPAYSDIVKLFSALGNANADVNNGKFLTNSIMMGKLMSVLTFPSANTGKAVVQGNMLADYPAAFTTNVPSTLVKGNNSDCSAIIFGDFSELLVGQWGGIDMIVDPITKMEQSLTRVYVETFWDIAVRHAASFAAIQDARNV